MSEENYSEAKFYMNFVELLEKKMPDDFPGNGISDRSALFSNTQFTTLFDQAPGIVCVYNFANRKYEYFSKNVKEIIGHDAEDYIKGGLEFGMSTFHPDDAKIYAENVLPQMLNYFTILAPGNRLKNTVYKHCFRVRRKDGNYQWFLQQMNFIETDENGYPLVSTIFMFDINDVKKDNDVVFSISERVNGAYTTIYSNTFSADNITNLLSERELEILNLLGLGKSSNEIAEQLFISPHTVNTHRKRMLEKTGAMNTVQLLKLAMIKGLI